MPWSVGRVRYKYLANILSFTNRVCVDASRALTNRVIKWRRPQDGRIVDGPPVISENKRQPVQISSSFRPDNAHLGTCVISETGCSMQCKSIFFISRLNHIISLIYILKKYQKYTVVQISVNNHRIYFARSYNVFFELTFSSPFKNIILTRDRPRKNIIATSKICTKINHQRLQFEQLFIHDLDRTVSNRIWIANVLFVETF